MNTTTVAVPAVLTVEQTAAILGISRSAAYRAIGTGEIPHIRIGRRIVVPTGKLAAMLGWTAEELAALVQAVAARAA